MRYDINTRNVARAVPVHILRVWVVFVVLLGRMSTLGEEGGKSSVAVVDCRDFSACGLDVLLYAYRERVFRALPQEAQHRDELLDEANFRRKP